MRSIGKRDSSYLFQLGDELITYGDLHQLLVASVPGFLPLNVAEVRAACGHLGFNARNPCEWLLGTACGMMRVTHAVFTRSSAEVSI